MRSTKFLRGLAGPISGSGIPDFIEALLSSGRIVDLPMRDFFSQEETALTDGSCSALEGKIRHIREQSGKEGKALINWNSLVYGDSTGASWGSGLPSAATLRVEESGDRSMLSGRVLLAGEGASKPTKATLFVKTPASIASSSRLLEQVRVAEVNLEGSGVICEEMLPGVFRAEFPTPTTCSVLDRSQACPLQRLFTQNLSAVAAMSELLEKMENICSLHLTQCTQYDGLLLRNPAMHQRLAQLSTLRFGMDSALKYLRYTDPTRVVGTHEESAAVLESTALLIFAQEAIAAAKRQVNEVLHRFPLSEPRRFQGAIAERVIDYPLVKEWLESSHDVCSIMTGPVAQHGAALFTPLFTAAPSGGRSAAPTDYLMQLLGFQGGRRGGEGRLTSTHLNLKPAVQRVEHDVNSFWVQLASTSATALSELTFSRFLSLFLAELYVDIAVLHRGSAAVHRREAQDRTALDETPAAADAGAPELMPPHRESLLADGFHLFSHARRQALLSDWALAAASGQKAFPKGDIAEYLESCTTHPIQLVLDKKSE